MLAKPGLNCILILADWGEKWNNCNNENIGMSELDSLRYFLALVLVILVPMVIAYWLVIHLGADYWRRFRTRFAYICAALAMTATGVGTWLNRDLLIGPDLGFRWWLFGAGLAIYLLSLRLARPVRKQLRFSTFAGVPEISDNPTPLLTNGPYAIVRHPRYLMVLVGIIGWALMANFQSAYLTSIGCIIGMLGSVALEERELKERFGSQYLTYASEVPSILPRWRDLWKIWSL